FAKSVMLLHPGVRNADASIQPVILGVGEYLKKAGGPLSDIPKMIEDGKMDVMIREVAQQMAEKNAAKPQEEQAAPQPQKMQYQSPQYQVPQAGFAARETARGIKQPKDKGQGFREMVCNTSSQSPELVGAGRVRP